jgi:hypothetical protein
MSICYTQGLFFYAENWIARLLSGSVWTLESSELLELSELAVLAELSLLLALVAALPVPAIWKAMTPPKGPAREAMKCVSSGLSSDGLESLVRANLRFAILRRQTLFCPPMLPLQVVPAGIATLKGYILDS